MSILTTKSIHNIYLNFTEVYTSLAFWCQNPCLIIFSAILRYKIECDKINWEL